MSFAPATDHSPLCVEELQLFLENAAKSVILVKKII
jgi:hypothetical protein